MEHFGVFCLLVFAVAASGSAGVLSVSAGVLAVVAGALSDDAGASFVAGVMSLGPVGVASAPVAAGAATGVSVVAGVSLVAVVVSVTFAGDAAALVVFAVGATFVAGVFVFVSTGGSAMAIDPAKVANVPATLHNKMRRNSLLLSKLLKYNSGISTV
ncbi:MAG: hypothetical protein FWE88_06985 [Phycisphaerae bacterium]|nr:hypothetical protein [Phycisphaerae bacterium]